MRPDLYFFKKFYLLLTKTSSQELQNYKHWKCQKANTVFAVNLSKHIVGLDDLMD